MRAGLPFHHRLWSRRAERVPDRAEQARATAESSVRDQHHLRAPAAALDDHLHGAQQPAMDRSAYGATHVRRTASFTAAATSLTSGWWTRQRGMSTMRCEPSWNMPTFGRRRVPRTASRARWR